MSDIVLEIKDRTRRVGAFTAVDALNLSVNAGEVFGCIPVWLLKTSPVSAQRNSFGYITPMKARCDMAHLHQRSIMENEMRYL